MRREICILDIPKTGNVTVNIERKNISSCRLKLFPSQKIKLSVPNETPSGWIENYLKNKKDWIIKKLENFEKTKGYEATVVINNGISIRLLGQDMIFSIYKSEKKRVTFEYRSIYIGLPNISDSKETEHLFDKWWRKQAFSVYSEVLDTLYPIVEKHNINKPNLKIRKMKTLWGSSSPHKGIITLNFYLLKAKKPCIEYVILHELTHTLFPHHDRQFFDFLTLYMPDWKDRKNILDTEVVQGL